MSVRTALIAALCLVFIVTWGLGAHLHWSHGPESLSSGHAHTHEHLMHIESGAYVAAEFSAWHLDSHVLHGDIDLDSGAAAEKIRLLKFHTALFALIGSLLLLIPTRPPPISLPPWRPPRHRPRPYLLLPPSQAPPCAA